jgi:pyruvate dehydrogenase E2 component (dihydrolipoamide acetyltransferase)
MATNILMEALSPTMEEGRLVEWKKQEGDPVAAGDVVAEVETDKAVMDLIARAGGTLLKQLVPAGTTVPVSTPLGVIGEKGESVSASAGSTVAKPAGKQSPDGPTVGRGGAAPATQVAAAPLAVASPRPTATAPAGVAPTVERPDPRLKASPLARKMATERGVDLGSLVGSGPEGRIVARDVPAERGDAASPAPIARPAMVSSEHPFTDVPLTQLRKTIAKRLAQSIGPIPTFYLTTEIDMERVAESRDALNRGGGGGPNEVRVSFNDVIIKVAAMALRQHPGCNAWWQDDHIRYWRDIHLSLAVAVEDGLITPVIRHPDQKSLREIAVEARDLATRARSRRLKPEEYSGGTFSVSNLGMFDIDQFTAVINPPEAGILAVGSIAPKPVAMDGAVQVRRRLRVTLSCDHRVIDGATGAAYLKTLKTMLENPLAIVW